jgi:HicB-like protein involved in pilus formation
MDLTPYLESLRRELVATAAAGGEEMTRAAEVLSSSLEAATRLSLMEALSDAADDVTAKLGNISVEVRLRGRDAELVVNHLETPEPAPAAPPPGMAEGSGDVARITLRLPEGLKEAVERTAATEGISVNAWLVRAIAVAVGAPQTPPFPPGRASFGRRVTGFAQA